jgi:hypothetical protein
MCSIQTAKLEMHISISIPYNTPIKKTTVTAIAKDVAN